PSAPRSAAGRRRWRCSFRPLPAGSWSRTLRRAANRRRGVMKDHARAGVVLFALVAALVALSSPGIASADDDPVPSIDPDWSAQFVPPAMPRLRAALRCTPVDAVFYDQTDWLRLAQRLRSNPSTCANYYVSVPPLAADTAPLR